MTKKEMQQFLKEWRQLEKTFEQMKKDIAVIKDLRKQALEEIDNIGKSYDKLKNLI